MQIPDKEKYSPEAAASIRSFIWSIWSVDRTLVFLAPVLLLPAFLPEFPLLPRVIVSALVALAAWWFPFLRDLRLEKQSLVTTSNLLATGFTLLFIIPGVYITVFYDTFESIREQYTDYYPQALALVAIAGYFYLIGYNLIGKWRQRKAQPGFSVEIKKVRMYAFLIVSIVIHWMIRFWLLKTGTYYHTMTTDFQFNNYAFLAMIYTIESISYVCLYAFFISCLKENRKWLWAVVMLIGMDIAWYLGANQKSQIFRILIAVSLCLIMYTRPTLRKALVIGSLMLGLVVFTIPLMSKYESVIHEAQVNPTVVDVGQTLSYLVDSNANMSSGVMSPINLAFQRLGDIRSLGALYYAVPSNVDYIYGASYWGILFSFIPHILWPNKPDYEIRTEIMSIVFPFQYASSPLTLVGEAFINFPVYGVPLVFLLIGILASRFDSFFLPRASLNPWWGGFIAAEGYRILWTSMVLGQVISPLLRMMLLTAILSFITTKTTENDSA